MNACHDGGALRVSRGLRSAPTLGCVVLLIAGRVSTSAAAEAVPTPYVPYQSEAIVVGSSATAATPHPGDGAPIRILPPGVSETLGVSEALGAPKSTLTPPASSQNSGDVGATPATSLSTIDAGRLVPVTLPTATSAPKAADAPHASSAEGKPDVATKQGKSKQSELKPAAVRPATTSSMSSGLPPMSAINRPNGAKPAKSNLAEPDPAQADPATQPKAAAAATTEAGPLREIRPAKRPEVAGSNAVRPTTPAVDPPKSKSAQPAATKKPAVAPSFNLPQPPIPFIEAARRSGRLLLDLKSSRSDRLRKTR